MATTYLPIINSEDYQAFRRILGPNLPDAYDDWRQLISERSLQVARSGHTARGIEVHPDEFTVWLTGHGQDRSANGLDNFVFYKGSTLDNE